MGSGNIFKAMIGSKRGKQKSDKVWFHIDAFVFVAETNFVLTWPCLCQGVSTAVKKKGAHASSLVTRSEDWAATRIQAAFKAYKVH